MSNYNRAIACRDLGVRIGATPAEIEVAYKAKVATAGGINELDRLYSAYRTLNGRPQYMNPLDSTFQQLRDLNTSVNSVRGNSGNSVRGNSVNNVRASNPGSYFVSSYSKSQEIGPNGEMISTVTKNIDNNGKQFREIKKRNGDIVNVERILPNGQVQKFAKNIKENNGGTNNHIASATTPNSNGLVNNNNTGGRYRHNSPYKFVTSP